jgi:hypothetical protein
MDDVQPGFVLDGLSTFQHIHGQEGADVLSFVGRGGVM